MRELNLGEESTIIAQKNPHERAPGRPSGLSWISYSLPALKVAS